MRDNILLQMRKRYLFLFFLSSRRRHTRWPRDWSSDVCSSDLSVQTIDIYHTIGTDETDVGLTNGNNEDFVKPNKELKEILDSKGVTYHYHELEGGEHTWKYWQKDLPNALKKMFI